MNVKQMSLWILSIFLLILSTLIFAFYKPTFLISLNDLIVGLLAGMISYYVGVKLRTKSKKQFIRIWGIFVESVIIAPLPEEIIFRFALISLTFNDIIVGILISSLIWSLFHVISEFLSDLPIRYYRTKLGFFDNYLSGVIFSTIYVFTGFNLFTPWVAHAFHNFLIWKDIAS